MNRGFVSVPILLAIAIGLALVGGYAYHRYSSGESWNARVPDAEPDSASYPSAAASGTCVTLPDIGNLKFFSKNNLHAYASESCEDGTMIADADPATFVAVYW